MLFALAGALGYGFASVLQAAAARDAGAPLRTLVRPLYLLGLALDLLGWGCSLVALRTLAVAVVQPVMAGSLVVTALAGWVALGARLRRREIAAIVVAVAALATLATVTGPHRSPGIGPGPGPAAGWALLVAAAALVAVGLGVKRNPQAAAVVAGVAFGGAALCAQVLTLPALDRAFLLARQPAAGALVVFGGTGMLLYAAALERGSVGPVTALLWVAEIVAPTLAGALFFADPLPRTPLAVGALVAAVCTAVVLAHADPADPVGGPPPGRRQELTRIGDRRR